MRHLATFVSFGAVALSAGAAIRGRLPWPIWTYLVAQSCFALCGWWALQRSTIESRFYLLTFGILFGLALGFAVLVAIAWPLDFWVGVLLIPSLAVTLALSALAIYHSLPSPVSSRLKLPLVQGAVLLFCGVLTLLALSQTLPPELRYSALALGIFWTAQGVHGWAYAGSRGTWEAGNWFVPQMLAIACFGWLFFSLSGAQPETARQHARDEVALSEMQHLEAN